MLPDMFGSGTPAGMPPAPPPEAPGRPGPGNYLSGTQTGPFFDRTNLGGTLASFGSQAIPGAAAFQSELFNPGFSPMETAFLDTEAARQSRMLNPMLAAVEHQYGGTPFHSGLLSSIREMGEGMALNLGNQATQLGMNRQNQATGQLGRIMGGSPMDNLAQAQAGVTDQASFTQGLLNSVLQPVQAISSGSTFIPSSIIASSGSRGGK